MTIELNDMKTPYPHPSVNLLTTPLKRAIVALCMVMFTALMPVKLFAQTPIITSFSPANGPVGTTVTVSGTSFNATAVNNIVFFGATRATVTVASATSLTVSVPTGATYGPITVLNTANNLAAYSARVFMPTFTPNTGSITTADIAPKVDFATGTGPIDVAIGDIDGDGKPDVVILNQNSSTVSVLRNTSSPGNPGFAPKVDFATGGGPLAVCIGDIDGDGKPDLVVLNHSNNTVSVLRNTSSPGNPDFAARVNFATGSDPFFVAIGDIDGDGKPDIAVANSSDNSVSVLLNTSSPGNVGFAIKVDFATGMGPFSVAIGDIDGDGKADIATANAADNTVSVLLNTSSPGNASFAAEVVFASSSFPFCVIIGDLDGDGKPDLVVANAGVNTVSVFRNTGSTGNISFAAKLDFTVSANNQCVVIGDIDGDGKPDLVVPNGSGTVSVLRNTSSSGNVNFAAEVDFKTGTNPLAAAVGDIDGDGKPDLVVPNAASKTVSVFRNTPLFPPTTQATNVTFASTTATATTASWTNGNGASRAVFMLAGPSGSPTPVNLTAYNANATFSSGDQIGATGWYCVYNGTGSTVNITDLTAATTYQLMVVEYNGTGSNVAYLTTAGTGNPAGFNISKDAMLANLTISNGTLIPGFSSGIFTYNATIANFTSSITIVPTTDNPNATITVNGNPATSGVRTSSIPMSVGANTLTIVATAQDGVTTQTYTITVNRSLPGNALLTSIALSPKATLVSTIGPDYLDLTAAVTNSISSIKLLPTAQDGLANITVNGTPVASGALSQNIPLNVGANTITTVITAEDGVTTKTAVITVNREGAAVASLANLTISAGTLSPAFANSTLSYTASVPYPTSAITLTPTTTDPNATVTVNGKPVSSPVVLNVGLNKIITKVTAQNGTTFQIYTTYISRAAPSTNALYASIALSPVSTLVGVAGPGYLNFTSVVADSETSVQVIATAKDPTATITVNGQPVTSGSLSQIIALNVGSNTLTTVITAQDGVTSKTVVITVTRMAQGSDSNVYQQISVSKPADDISLEDGIVVHQAVSPNGDGINDFLTIEGIRSFPNNSLMIVNRNGVMVYQAKGYDNGSKIFDGHSNINGKMQLPGTYFYSLDYTAANGEAKHKTGYIILKY
jgi:gliding motility-associated-like protein